MKRTIQALIVAALLNGTQALAEDSPIVLPSKSTYADEHAAELAAGNFGSAFPGEAPEMIVLKSEWTYADRSTDKVAAVSAFPGEAPETIVLESRSTYADSFAAERNMQARSASDPALSE